MKRQPVPNGRILHNEFDIREGTADWHWKELRVGIGRERESVSRRIGSNREPRRGGAQGDVEAHQDCRAGMNRLASRTAYDEGATGGYVSPL